MSDHEAPLLDPATGYAQACASGKLLFQKCPVCLSAQLPISRACASCGHIGLDVCESSGRGTIHSYTVVHRAPSAFFKEAAPYSLALIDFDESFRALMQFMGAGPQIGERIVVRFSTSGPNGETLPQAWPDEANG